MEDGGNFGTARERETSTQKVSKKEGEQRETEVRHLGEETFPNN